MLRRIGLILLIAIPAMAIEQLDTENADRNLTSQATVLTHTPDASNAMWCQGLVMLGDGTKNLDGSGGNFELTVTIGGQTVQPDPDTIAFSTAARSAVWTDPFVVPDNNEVVIKFKSPNGADTDVDVTAYLFDIGINTITAKLPTNYIMGSSVVTAKDDEIDAIKAITDVFVEDTGTLAAVEDANEFTLANTAEDVNDCYNGMTITLRDATDSHYETRYIEDCNDGRVVWVDRAFSFTPATADSYWVWNLFYFPTGAWGNIEEHPRFFVDTAFWAL